MDEVGRAYGANSKQYIERFGSSAQVHADELALISRHMSITSGAVLDVGCGPGHLTEHLRSLGVEAIGIDPVREFIQHARASYPDGRYTLGSMFQLPVPDRSAAGILAWYSLIHISPKDLDGALAELRRSMAASGTLLVGFFDGHDVAPFEHTVATAYYWPVDKFSARLERAGFTEIERMKRPGIDVPGHRPHAAMAAIAT